MRESHVDNAKRFENFAEFYPYYLSEHSNPVCRALHYIGTSLGFAILVYAVVTLNWLLVLAGITVGYLLAWIGHFFFEHNKPATFQYPFFSFIADWVMLKDFLTGRLSGRLAG